MATSTGSKWKFTRDEIRKKLEELGYHNIPDQALREFSNDLHGLISTENGQGSLPDRDINYNSSETSWCNSPSSTTTSEQSIYNDNEPRRQERQPYGSLSVHNSGKHGYDKDLATKPNSQGKQHHLVKGSTSLFVAPDKENLNESTTLRLAQKRKVLRKKDGKSRVFDESFTNISVTDISDLEHRLHELPVKYETDNVSVNSDHSEGASSSSLQSWGKNRNVLPSFIRPRSCDSGTLGVRKSDPVNRYHQFKQEWTSNKVPGEKMHKHLRWATREQMLQYETFEKPQHRYTPNNYVAPTEKKRQALRWEVRSNLANI